MLIGDLTTRSLLAALGGLGQRSQAIRHNVANVETSGFQAVQVSFEASLAAAMRQGRPEATTVATTRSLAPTRPNGNNVAIDQELTTLTADGLHQQAAIEALNAKYRLVRTAITGQ